MHLAVCLLLFAQPVPIDRIAIVVNRAIIKDSDIDTDLRVTEFLNGEKLTIDAARRKKAAAKLIEQIFLREEIRTGGYANASREEAEKQLAALTTQRFRTPAALQAALQRYGLDETTLREQFRWQLTVLEFINARFKPAAAISDAAVDKYSKEHPAAGAEKARDILTEEEVNRLFFAWLDERKKEAKIVFREEGLS